MAAAAGRLVLKAKAKVKGKCSEVPSATSHLGKYLGISPPKRSDTTTLVATFIKLNNPQSPAMKKDGRCIEKLKALLDGKDKVGTPEIAKLLSPQFVTS